MLEIVIPETELYDESTETFETVKAQTLQLEHSLVSISKWEAKWHVPFLEQKERTEEQLLYYIQCMTVTRNIDPNIYKCLSRENAMAINAYIEDPMTATTIKRQESRNRGQSITSELIYSWMVALQIPFECEKWHLNRLLTLIQVCNIQNSPSKKMSNKDLAHYNHSLNQARKAKLGTRG